MSQFNTNKWFKNQYLKEAGLKEGLQADNIYDTYFEAVVKQIEDSRFDDPELIQFLKRYKNYIEMDVKSWEMSKNLNEAPGSTLNLSQADMDKLHKDGKLEIDGHKLVFKVEESLNEAEEMATYKVHIVTADPYEGGPDEWFDHEVKVEAGLEGDDLNASIRDAIYDMGYTRRSIYKINYEKA